MRKTRSLEPDYFEGLYAADADPWRFETSAYERAKYAATIAALGDAPVALALEVGCSIGVLTLQLAARCDHLVAVDVSASALDRARQRCADLGNIEFRLAQIPRDPAPGLFDLIVLSEVAYYWDDDDLTRAAAMFAAQHSPGGRVLLVHWLGETDYPKTADDAVDGLKMRLGDTVSVERAVRHDDYRLDLWRWTA
jgi:SAM-dependent methyltransferase